MRKQTALLTVLVVMAMCIPCASAARRGKQPATVVLTQAGGKLLESYSNQLTALKSDIAKALPKITEQKKSAYLKALGDEKVAEAGLKAARQNLANIQKGNALVGHAKGKWIGGADNGIAKSRDMLKKATTEAERNAAQKELIKWQKNRQDGLDALKERQAFLDDAMRQKPKWDAQLEAAKNNLANAKANSMKAANELDMNAFLVSDKLDAKLAKYQVLSEATPQGLAVFAQQGRAQKTLIKKLLADDDLMIQMAIAGGAKAGKYGQAMKIYTDIQKASKEANNGVLQRLALGTSLEHAVAIGQRNATGLTDAPATVNPVNRYLHFENAYLFNELDPAFKDLSVWDYRMVINGQEPDEIHTWGREMLRNYRPDHITTGDYRWRYVATVRTDIRYGSQYNKCDKTDLQFFQNIMMNGGVCGRRAFFGRFILRSFGIPTTARPQRGHATLVHWTPDGWVICLGAGWGVGWVNGPEATRRGKGESSKDTIFLAQTQARMTGKPYKQVWRAKTASTVLANDDASETWNTVTLYRQRAIIKEAKAVTLAAVGTDIGEANESKIKEKVNAVTITAADRMITVGNGVITIPAAACSKPTNSTSKIKFMKSNLGGMQLHYNRTSKPELFEYTFDAPKAGKYLLTARVVTPSWKQHLLVNANAGAGPIDIELPFTVGKWDNTQPVEITLAKGKNVLTFSRENVETLKGITIKDFTLKPVN